MNTKKIFKKLTAVATGVTMMGATMAGALAADLSDYPDLFVSEGTFDGLIVLGENAATVDNLAAIDISNSMEYMMAGETSTTTIEGDSWLAATSSDFLELHSEGISDIESELDSEQLDALADGVVKNSKGTSDYEQTLTFPSGPVVDFQEADDDSVGWSLLIDNGELYAQYELDFQTDLDSDIDGDDALEDIEDEVIVMLGVSYTITSADFNGEDDIVLTLMGGSTADTISEGETKTYTVNDADYEVSLDSISGDPEEARFTVNGETTSGVEDGETEVLEDGTTIGVTDITYQDYAGGIHSATFTLGADKYVLDGGDNSVEHNEDDISGLTVEITSTNTSDEVSIETIEINMSADDDYYVSEGGMLSDNPELGDAEEMWTENWDINFASVDVEMDETFAIEFSEGDEQAILTVELEDGSVDFELVHYENDTVLRGGDDDDDTLAWDPATLIEIDNYFFLSTDDPVTDDEAETYLLQYRSAESDDDDSDAVIRNVVTGVDYTRSTDDGSFDLKLGGETFDFANASSSDTDDYNLTVTGGSTVHANVSEDATISFRTDGGHLVTINDANTSDDSSNWVVTFNVDDGDLFDDDADADIDLMVFTLSLDTDDDELDISYGNTELTTGDVNDLFEDEDDDDVSYSRSVMGDLLTITDSDSGLSKATLEVPGSAAEVQLYVTSGATTTSTTADGTLTKVSVVDATKLDSEVADVSAQNLLVVGGPCVNSVAAELLASGADCAAGFQAGVARVKLFENGDSVAMLVAGYSGEDTRLAGKVIAHRASELSGDEVEIEGTTYSDATISAPSEEMAEEAVVEEEAEEEAVAEE